MGFNHFPVALIQGRASRTTPGIGIFGLSFIGRPEFHQEGRQEQLLFVFDSKGSSAGLRHAEQCQGFPWHVAPQSGKAESVGF